MGNFHPDVAVRPEAHHESHYKARTDNKVY